MPRPYKISGNKRVVRFTQESLRGVIVGYFGSQMFFDDMDALTPQQRTEQYIKLLPYIFPKMQAVTVATNEIPVEFLEKTNRLLALAEGYNKED